MDEDLEKLYSNRQPVLNELGRLLERETIAALAGLRHIDRVTYRAKGLASFLTKAIDRENELFYSDPLVEIEDQVAGRVITFFLNDLAIVKERLAGTYSTVEGWTPSGTRCRIRI